MKAVKASQPLPPSPLAILSNPDTVQWQMQQLQHQVACRAFELFESRSGEHGHDWEDWFQAESELLRPVSIAMLESDDRLSVRANVLGFDETELKVSIEPLRISIVGRKGMSQAETEGGKRTYIDWYPDQIMRVIPLPMEIVPEKADIELRAGVLKFELPKAARQQIRPLAKTA